MENNRESKALRKFGVEVRKFCGLNQSLVGWWKSRKFKNDELTKKDVARVSRLYDRISCEVELGGGYLFSSKSLRARFINWIAVAKDVLNETRRVKEVDWVLMDRIELLLELQSEKSSKTDLYSSGLKSDFDFIMDKLTSCTDLKTIRLSRMAGMPRTTLVKAVAKEASFSHRVIAVAVSKTLDIEGIQNRIADELFLKMEGSDRRARVEFLRNGLKRERKVLVILDDVWDELDLEDIGIPCDESHGGCIVFYTTQSDEASVTFTFHGGVAPVKRCLETELDDTFVALQYGLDKFMRGRKTHDVITSCFFLCCLFPEHQLINVEVLTIYAWGLRLYEGVNSVSEVRHNVLEDIEILTDRCLLSDHGEDGVKIVDEEVRDSVLRIVSERSIPLLFPFPFMIGLEDEPSVDDENLRMLLLDRGSRIKSSTPRLEGMKSLKVFHLRDGYLSAASLETLSSLLILQLIRCQLDDISALGKLENLEILILRGSDFSELPHQIADHLKLLDLWDCRRLKKIPLSLLRKLSQLEELLFNFLSFEEWWFEETGVELVGGSSEINPLQSQSYEVLIYVDDTSKSRILTVTSFSRNIVRKLFEENPYPITLPGLECLELEELPKSRRISNLLPDHTNLQNLVDLTVTDSSRLVSLFSFPMAQSMVNLKKLKINDCNELRVIISEALCDQHAKVMSFSSVSPCLTRLETLEINRCKKLEYVSRITTAYVSPQLKGLQILECPLLTHFFDVGKDGVVFHHLKQVSLQGLDEFSTFCSGLFSIDLPSLDTLNVRECPQSTNAISQIIKRDQLKRLSLVKVGRELYEKLFELQVGYFLSSLEELILDELHELKVIWKDPNQIISLQNLTTLKVVRCNKLKHIFSVQLARNLPQLSHLEVLECEEMEQVISKDPKESSSMASHKPVYFPKLEVIRITRCYHLKYLLPLSVSCFPKLKKLQVEEAFSLIQIFEHEIEENIKNNEQEIKLPALEELSLKRLDNFMAFSSVGYYFVFPKLRSIDVRDCPRRIMEFFDDWGHDYVRTKIEVSNRESYFRKKIGECVNEDIVKYERTSDSS